MESSAPSRRHTILPVGIRFNRTQSPADSGSKTPPPYAALGLITSRKGNQTERRDWRSRRVARCSGMIHSSESRLKKKKRHLSHLQYKRLCNPTPSSLFHFLPSFRTTSHRKVVRICPEGCCEGSVSSNPCLESH